LLCSKIRAPSLKEPENRCRWRLDRPDPTLARSPLTNSKNMKNPKSRHQTQFFIFTGCLLLMMMLGWVDYITGYELGFFVFYTVPIGLAAWYLGRWPGIVVAMGATIAWWLADALAGAKYSSRFSFCWNSTIHFSAFVINAVTIAKIKLDLNQRDEMAAKLDAASKALRAAGKVVPSCPL